MAELHITHAEQTMTRKLTGAIGTEYTIGRAEGNSICIPEAQDLSSSHCRVIKTEDGFVIQDNQSTNGVTLDGRKVDYELMLPGEVYMAASVQLVLVDGESAPESAESSGPKKLKRKKVAAAPGAKGVPGAKGAASAQEPSGDLKALAEKYKRNQGLSGADITYIVIVLLAAVYAGMALYSWQHDGNPMPLFFR